MFRNKLLPAFLLLAGVLVIYVTFFGSNAGDGASVDPEAYRRELAEERRYKDNHFRTSAESPITDKAAFRGLVYFDADPAYRVTARIEPFADKTQKLVVKLTDGSEEVYEKYAHAVFSLQGEVCRVLLLKHDKTLSLLFKDATNGKDTYGGGRYIDMEEDQVKDNRLVIDFNVAYNPFCAYNHTYACPLPPAENTLPVAVRAGEKYAGE